jgi:hypothetical protein
MQSKTVTFPGRVLHLSEDQEQLKAQLYGHDKLGYDPALVDAEIKTDQDRADALGLILDTDPRQRTDYGQEAEPSANNNGAESTPEGGERRSTLN